MRAIFVTSVLVRVFATDFLSLRHDVGVSISSAKLSVPGSSRRNIELKGVVIRCLKTPLDVLMVTPTTPSPMERFA